MKSQHNIIWTLSWQLLLEVLLGIVESKNKSNDYYSLSLRKKYVTFTNEKILHRYPFATERSNYNNNALFHNPVNM